MKRLIIGAMLTILSWLLCLLITAAAEAASKPEPGTRAQTAQSTKSKAESLGPVNVIRFSAEDVVRHPLVERIVRAYDADAAQRGRAV